MVGRKAHLTRTVVGIAVVLALSACGRGNQDLRTYIDDVKARPGGRIEPLPTVHPAPSFAYEAGDRRSPFVPDAPQRRVNTNPNRTDEPDPNRPREFLEQFPLDTMHMVGTLADKRSSFGLVQTADGLVHRVTVGNHLGQNYGKIVAITDSEIRLTEIISDGLGGYLERPAKIALAAGK
jgi:type IV pilus assembly protein PilP